MTEPLPVIAPPKRVQRRNTTSIREDIARTSSGMIAVKPDRAPQPQRSFSGIPSAHVRGAVAEVSGIGSAQTPSADDTEQQSFQPNVLAQRWGIEEGTDRDEQEDVEWQWGAPASLTAHSPRTADVFSAFASSSSSSSSSSHPFGDGFQPSTSPHQHGGNTPFSSSSSSVPHVVQHHNFMDLNAAFSQAFGGQLDTPTTRRKGHSRGLSSVFVSPPVTTAAAAIPAQAPTADNAGKTSPPSSEGVSFGASPPIAAAPISSSANAVPHVRSPGAAAAAAQAVTASSAQGNAAASANHGASNPFLTPATSSSSSSSSSKDPDYLKQRRASVSPRTAVTQKAAADVEKERRFIQRERVIRELLSSEQAYVDSLKKLVELFYRPLTAKQEGSKIGASLLSKSEADMLFGQVEVILLYNTRLLEELKERLQAATYNGATDCISDIFAKMKSFLQVYVGYSENYVKSMKTYELIMSRSTKAKKFIKNAEREAGNVLEAFLIQPIQRIPRYILLLKEIIKYTEPSHPDFEALSEAVEAIKELCAAINEAPKRLQEATAMLAVCKSLVPTLPDLLSPSRHLVMQERMWVINPDGAVKSRILFVFNDMLLVTRPEGGRYYLRYRIGLPNVEVHDSPSRMIAGQEAFIISLEAKARQIVLAFKDQEKKSEVLAKIEQHNPSVVAGKPSFVPLSERQGVTDTDDSGAAAISTSPPASSPLSSSATGVGVASAVPAGLASETEGKRSGVLSRKTVDVASVHAADAAASQGKLSGLLSRKNLQRSSTVIVPDRNKTSSNRALKVAGSRRGAATDDFEIKREDTGPAIVRESSSSVPASAPIIHAPEVAVDKTLLEMKKSLDQKIEEQKDLHKLLAFYRKCNDNEGLADATAQIAKYDEEIAALRQKLNDYVQQSPSARHKAVTETTAARRRHTRQRSLSTSSLPKLAADGSVVAPAASGAAVAATAPTPHKDLGESGSLSPRSAAATSLGVGDQNNSISNNRRRSGEAASSSSVNSRRSGEATAVNVNSRRSGAKAAAAVDSNFGNSAASVQLVPTAIVAATAAPAPAAVSAVDARPVCVALYDFEGANSGELTFKAGERIFLCSTEGGEWYLGQLNSGVKGWFPKSFCRVLQ